MQLPVELKEKIQSLSENLGLSDLAKESERLTFLYRNKKDNGSFNSLISDNQRLAYLVARFPATYAVGCQVLSEAMKRCLGDPLESMLDIGAGPGTLLLAATETGLPISKATMIERDPGFIHLGKQLSSDLAIPSLDWICQDARKELLIEPHDLIVASYSLNELTEKDRMEILEKLWGLTKKMFIIIEPGTKVAFESLKAMREKLLSLGGHLVAPCPHSNRCPLKENDWCHFSVRIERSSLHRKVKLGTLNYEDEKFSYLIFSKKKIEPCHSRVLRHPYKGSGFIKLQLCSKTGIEEKTITKKNKQHYLSSKKIEWGDEFNIV
jgi:ribosomal protein RSM22 (predicted rRNA methylase)